MTNFTQENDDANGWYDQTALLFQLIGSQAHRLTGSQAHRYINFYVIISYCLHKKRKFHMGPSTLKTVDQGANEEGLILRDKPAAVDLKATGLGCGHKKRHRYIGMSENGVYPQL